MRSRALVGFVLCLAMLASAIPSQAKPITATQPASKPAVITADAIGAITTVVGSGTVNANDFSVVRLTCPSGTVAVGGGLDPFNVLTMTVTSSGPTFAANSNRLIFQPDGPNPAPIGWQASVRNNDTSAKTYKVAVICQELTDVSTVVGSATVNGGSSSFSTAVVACPAGTTAIGGGIDLSNVLTMSVTASAPEFASNRLLFAPNGTNPAPTGWSAAARNENSIAGSFKVAVICRNTSNITTVVGSTTVAPSDFGVVTVSCPPGMIAVSGGLDPYNVLTMPVTSSGPTFSSSRLLFQPDGPNPAPTGWQASVRNISTVDPEAREFKVAVLCQQPTVVYLPLVIK